MTTSPEAAVLDTNILIYAVFRESPHHVASRNLLEQAQQSGARLYATAQSFAEFFSVVTNPRRVTVAKSPVEAIEAIEAMVSLPGLGVLAQPPDIVARWCELLRHHPVRGADVFDLQLLATMLANGITRLYAFNVSDFQPFKQIQVLTPTAQ